MLSEVDTLVGSTGPSPKWWPERGSYRTDHHTLWGSSAICYGVFHVQMQFKKIKIQILIR